MKFIISENKIYDLVVKYLDSMFDVDKIGWIYGADDMGNDVDYAAEFYIGDYGDDETIFRWYGNDYWTSDDAEGWGEEYRNDLSNKSPLLAFEDYSLSYQLDSIFGDRWEEPFKRWFEDNFHFPVKTILK